jgi:membrane protein implicated in regulation of membrane protease activity
MTNAGSVTSQNLNPMHGMTICSLWSAFTSAGAVGRHTGGLMTFGGSIFLIAVGLVLALAVNVSVSGVDLQLVGWILAGVGVLGLMMSLAFYWRRRSYVVEPPPVAPDDYPPRY